MAAVSPAKDGVRIGPLAERKLVHAGFVDVAAEAEQARAAVLGRAQVGESLPAAVTDVRHAGQGLDIINDGWPAPESHHRRERRVRL